MKILNTVQELWSYCLYCPLCKDVCRKMEIVPIYKDITIESWDKIDSNIKIFCDYYSYKNKTTHSIECNINCLNNSIQADCKTLIDIPSINCQFIGTCDKCINTFSISSAIIIDKHFNNVYNIGIDKDNILLNDGKNSYNITLLHYSKTMLISKCIIDEEGDLNENNAIHFPIMKLDFSKPKTVLNKIKTLLLFS